MQSARVNYPQEVEQAVNQTVQVYQQAVHTYDQLAAACATEEISMPGFCKFFRLNSQRLHQLTHHVINWQTMRGGKLFVPEVRTLVQLPADLYKQTIEKIVELALQTEKQIEQTLRQLHQITQSKQDFATTEYVEKKLIQTQLILIKMMANHVNGLRVSQNAYLYDRVTMMALVKKIRAQLAQRFQQQQQNQQTSNNTFINNAVFTPRTSSGVAAFVYPF